MDVCVTKDSSGNATAVDCPASRNWKLAAGVKCGDKVELPLGVVSAEGRCGGQSIVSGVAAAGVHAGAALRDAVCASALASHITAADAF